jgi:hypothetical protein
MEEKIYYPVIRVEEKSCSTLVRKRYDKLYYLKEIQVPISEEDVERGVHELHKKVYLTLMLEPLDGSWRQDENQENEVKRLKELKF